MKKIILPIIAIIMTFTACSAEVSYRSDLSAGEVMTETMKDFEDELNSMATMDDARVKAEALSDVDFEIVESFAVNTSAVSTSLNEIGIIKANSEEDAKTLKSQVETSMQNQADIKQTYADYLPEEYENVENASVYQSGVYVMYLIFDSETKDEIVTAFNNSVTE